MSGEKKRKKLLTSAILKICKTAHAYITGFIQLEKAINYSVSILAFLRNKKCWKYRLCKTLMEVLFVGLYHHLQKKKMKRSMKK